MGTQQRRSAISLSVAVLVAACGYQSAYVPKADRFGVVWRDNELVMVPPQTSLMCSPAGQWVETKNLAQGSTRNARRLAMVATHNRRVDEHPRRTGDDDDDDDDDVGLEGPAAAIAAVVVVATALTGTALGLALAPAGKPQHNAAVLKTQQQHNNALRLLEAECTSSAKTATPPRPSPASNLDPVLNAVTPSTSMILESGSEKKTPTDVPQEDSR